MKKSCKIPIWPKKLKIGDTIGIFAPSSPYNLDKLSEGLNKITQMGFKFKLQPTLKTPPHKDYLAGTDQQRLDCFLKMIYDPEIDAILAARGGYGAMRLLTILKDKWFDLPPKAILGFSDITAMHLKRYQVSNIVGYHSPVAVSLSRTEDSCLENLENLLKHHHFSWTFSADQQLKAGSAKGILLGGNLSILIHMMATQDMPDLTGAILMIEDINESPYRLDRLLTTLKLNAGWKKLSALIFGNFSNCGSSEFVKNLILEHIEDFSGPVIYNAPFGHENYNSPWPLGAMACIEDLKLFKYRH